MFSAIQLKKFNKTLCNKPKKKEKLDAEIKNSNVKSRTESFFFQEKLKTNEFLCVCLSRRKQKTNISVEIKTLMVSLT